MTTTTQTLADFILARVSEDEAAAKAASDRQRVTWATTADTAASVAGADAGLFILFHDPARVLAQCAAVRAIVAEAVERLHVLTDGRGTQDRSHTLRHLAAIWADHEAYDEGWAAQ